MKMVDHTGQFVSASSIQRRSSQTVTSPVAAKGLANSAEDRLSDRSTDIGSVPFARVEPQSAKMLCRRQRADLNKSSHMSAFSFDSRWVHHGSPATVCYHSVQAQ